MSRSFCNGERCEKPVGVRLGGLPCSKLLHTANGSSRYLDAVPGYLPTVSAFGHTLTVWDETSSACVIRHRVDRSNRAASLRAADRDASVQDHSAASPRSSSSSSAYGSQCISARLPDTTPPRDASHGEACILSSSTCCNAYNVRESRSVPPTTNRSSPNMRSRARCRARPRRTCCARVVPSPITCDSSSSFAQSSSSAETRT
jgi:hypothetical protein